jgi:hypothetical protein
LNEDMSLSTSRPPYADDEDVALRVGSDLRLLYPADQVVASGTDGTFTVSDPWKLSSVSTSFIARGVTPGQVVQLLKPVSAFAAPGVAVVVDAIAASGLTLRRKGRPPGSGQPPAGPSGLTGVEFVISTFAPQLERASAEIERRLGLDPAIPGRTPTESRDLEALRDATVLLVLAQAYEALDRAGGGDEAISSKSSAIRREFDDSLGRLSSRWCGVGPGNRLGTRLSR